MPLLLVIPDPPDIADAAGEGAPELPALSELMRQGEVSLPDRDWRSGLLRDLGLASLASVAPAEIAAQALALEPGSSVCIATPVHVVAGMSRVHLHAEGVLRLAPAQRDSFHAAFVAQFGTEPLLHAAGEGWLLQAPWAHVADDGDPGEWRGAPLSRLPAATPALQAMRRTGAEIEMWLAGSNWNQGREQRGDLLPNLLWLWGGGRVADRPAVPAAQGLRLCAGNADPWLAGMAALAGRAVQPLPPEWCAAEWSEESQASAPAVFLLPAAGMEAGHWQDLERRWFEPLLRELRARRIRSLTIRMGRRSWQVRLRRWRSLLRRPKPWWQAARA
jgi:hypothetical protein